MQKISDFFGGCRDFVAGKHSSGNLSAGQREFLSSLEYQDRVTARDTCTTENRIALLDLAAKFEDLFTLPMPNAPNAHFLGGKFRHEPFDVSGHDPEIVSTGGRGKTKCQAFESCIGEAAGYLSFVEHPNDPLIFHDSTFDVLPLWMKQWSKLGLDTEESQLAKFASVVATNCDDGSLLNIPAELVIRRIPSKQIAQRVPRSDGVASGVSLNSAIDAASLELIERDAIALWWYGQEPARHITDGSDFGNEFFDMLTQIRGASRRKIWFLDVTTDLEIPVFVSLSSESDGSAVVGGFAANPVPQIAAERAFLEMCQMELAQQISIEKQEYVDELNLTRQDKIWIDRHKSLSVSNFPHLNKAKTQKFNGNNKLHASNSGTQALLKRKFNVLFVDLTRPSILIPTARVIIPGLQSTDPSWTSDRLRKIMDNNNVDQINTNTSISPI